MNGSYLLPGVCCLWLAAETVLAQPPSAPAGRAEPAGAAKPKENFCVKCHGEAELWEKEQKRLHVTEADLANDIHWQKGILCQDCHGGNPKTTNFNQAHAIESGYRPVKEAKNIPEFCGHCHANIEYMRRFRPSPRTDQLTEYWTSGHGQRLKATGDPQVATCVSCHGGHGIRAVSDLQSPVYPTRLAETCATCHSDAAKMANRQYHGRALGHGQHEQWRQSVHGQALLERGDLSAPTCNDCHGNHGAVPPEVGSVANACGTCHGRVADLFAKTEMKHRFEATGLPGCATCHGNHQIRSPTDEMLGMQEGGVCVQCHERGQHGATVAGAEAARQMRRGIEDLKSSIVAAEQTLAEAERLGMEVRPPRFRLRAATTALTNARATVHSFEITPIQAAIDDGLKVTAEVQERAEAALAEHTARRVWLAASLVPILAVVVLLLLYIRTLPVAEGKEA